MVLCLSSNHIKVLWRGSVDIKRIFVTIKVLGVTHTQVVTDIVTVAVIVLSRECASTNLVYNFCCLSFVLERPFMFEFLLVVIPLHCYTCQHADAK